MLSFEWLIDPITPASFFKDYYERKPLLIQGRDPDKFTSMLSIAAIDRYLATSTPHYPDVFVVDAARELKPEEYSTATADGAARIDLPRAYQLFDSGSTISLSHLHEQVPELAALCRAVEHAFSAHFQTNIYLSPRNAQGFKTHYDSHDVFVLQVAGSKIWTLYDTGIELPLHGQGFEPGKHIPGPPSTELTLKAGDVFYCPRGLYHSARSTDDVSLHITLGLIGKTWADIMIEAVSQACLASPVFRANLPVGYANQGFDTRQAEATFSSLLETFSRDAKLAPLLKRFAESFVTSRRPALQGCLQELDHPQQVSPDSRLIARPHLIYLLQEGEEGDKLVILFGSTQISLPSFTRDAVHFALSGQPFLVSDLPGEIDDAGKVVLARRLIKEGLLDRLDGAAGTGVRQRSAGLATGESAAVAANGAGVSVGA
jgi:ribosomal protein L16 Arg81 hydroxylase